MSTLSQSERKALNDLFGVIAQKESKASKFKNTLFGIVYFVKYFFKTKKSRFFIR